MVEERGNSSTNVKTFTSSDNLDLFNLPTGSRELAISKLLDGKNCPFFAIYILLDESLYIFGRWLGGGAPPPQNVERYILEYVDCKKGKFILN
jgi:hypothetical protein